MQPECEKCKQNKFWASIEMHDDNAYAKCGKCNWVTRFEGKLTFKVASQFGRNNKS